MSVDVEADSELEAKHKVENLCGWQIGEYADFGKIISVHEDEVIDKFSQIK